METITIPKQFTKKGELIVIARERYETLLKIADKKTLDSELQEAIDDWRKGNVQGPFASISALKKSLGR